LFTLYREAKRDGDAHALLLKVADRELRDEFDSEYTAARRVEELNAVAGLFLELGHPAEAVRTYNGVLGDARRLQLAGQRYSRQTPRLTAEQGRAQALQALKSEMLPATLRELLAPPEPRPAADGAVDLLLLVYPEDIPHATLTSLLARAVRLAADTPE